MLDNPLLAPVWAAGANLVRLEQHAADRLAARNAAAAALAIAQAEWVAARKAVNDVRARGDELAVRIAARGNRSLPPSDLAELDAATAAQAATQETLKAAEQAKRAAEGVHADHVADYAAALDEIAAAKTAVEAAQAAFRKAQQAARDSELEGELG